MNETGVAMAGASDGGSDGFKMETVVQQCVEVDICNMESLDIFRHKCLSSVLIYEYTLFSLTKTQTRVSLNSLEERTGVISSRRREHP